MRIWRKGSAPAFQAGGAGSIPVIRSIAGKGDARRTPFSSRKRRPGRGFGHLCRGNRTGPERTENMARKTIQMMDPMREWPEMMSVKDIQEFAGIGQTAATTFIQ